MNLESYIREVPNFPKGGIMFKDICPLLQNPDAFRSVIDEFYTKFKDKKIDVVVGIESRGFLFAGPLAYKLRASLVPVRKIGKLPSEVLREEYSLEYGTNAVEIHKDAIVPGQKVLLIDDLLATGGTMCAAINLVKKLGGQVAAIAFLVELGFLGGRKVLSGHEVVSLIQY